MYGTHIPVHPAVSGMSCSLCLAAACVFFQLPCSIVCLCLTALCHKLAGLAQQSSLL